MRCIKCSRELTEKDKFCPKCGNPVQKEGVTAQEEVTDKEQVQRQAPMVSAKGERTVKNKGKKVILLAGLAGGIVLVIIAVFLSIKLLGNNADKNNDNKDNHGVENTDGVSVSGNTVSGNTVSGNATGMEEPLYHIDDIGSINIFEQNYVPEARVEGQQWDSTLFYWLEDIDASVTTDGNIVNCVIYKTQMRNETTGNLIQYEIYKDKETGEVYKIVSVEQQESGLKLTDYYYDNGKPNFVFMREDSVYTPTYATIGKTGNRYYFANDSMIRWRIISVPGVIDEYVLTPTDVTYRQLPYNTVSAEEQNAYDITEKEILNAAYNTYNAVANVTGIGTLEGYMKDTTGTPIADVTVSVYRKTDDVLLYETVTGEDGYFRIYTYLDNTECYIVIKSTDTYKEHTINGVYLSVSSLNYSYNTIVLHKISGDEYPVYVDLYSAIEVQKGDAGVVCGSMLQGATVTVREGSGTYEGDALKTFEVGEDGRLHTNLPSGVYTAQIELAGYADSYLEIEVAECETVVTGYLIPALQPGETGVVMTWSGADVDLDLTLFTPYQSSGGDMAHIGGNVGNDAYGNRLVSDNNAYCEVMYVNTAQMGNYKLFVNNYTDSLAGNYSSSVLATINVYVYIYDCNGFVTVYTFPLNQSGVVWEVVEINGASLTPVHRVYEQVEGKQWWVESKEAGRLVQEINYFLPDGEWSVRSSTEYVYDDTGRVLYKIVNYGDGYYDEIYYSYDSQGRIETETINTYGFNNVSENIQYYYDDDQGKLIYIDVYWGGGAECDRRIEYSYDNLGRVSSIGRYYLNPLGEWEQAGSGGDWYEYDDNGNLSIEHCDGQKNIYHFYDSKGNILMSIEVSDDEYDYITGYTEYIYENASGNRVTIDNWQSAYLDIILETEAESADSIMYHLNYDFVYLDNDEIPELVVDCDYCISVYSYKGGTVYTYIDDWMYGISGLDRPEYSMSNGMVRQCISADFGATQYNIFYKINDLNSLEEVYRVTYQYYSDLNGNGFYDGDEPWLDNPIIMYDGREITEAEYNALPYSGYYFEYLGTEKTAYEAVEALHGM